MEVIFIAPQLWEEVERMINEGYVRLPVAALRDKRLTMTDCAVLAVIIDKAEEREVQLSAALIAAAAACSVRSVKAAVARLEACGYISVTHREGAASLFRQCEVLPPKRTARAAKKAVSESATSIEEYKAVINKFLY